MIAYLASVSAASATERSTELVDSFASFYTPGPPDFATLDAKATAMKLLVHNSLNVTQAHPITASPGSSRCTAAPTFSSVGRYAGLPMVKMKQALMKTMKLGSPDRLPAGTASGVTRWKYADDVNLLLDDQTADLASCWT
jgi:hypothetical protein